MTYLIHDFALTSDAYATLVNRRFTSGKPTGKQKYLVMRSNRAVRLSGRIVFEDRLQLSLQAHPTSATIPEFGSFFSSLSTRKMQLDLDMARVKEVCKDVWDSVVSLMSDRPIRLLNRSGDADRYDVLSGRLRRLREWWKQKCCGCQKPSNYSCRRYLGRDDSGESCSLLLRSKNRVCQSYLLGPKGWVEKLRKRNGKKARELNFFGLRADVLEKKPGIVRDFEDPYLRFAVVHEMAHERQLYCIFTKQSKRLSVNQRCTLALEREAESETRRWLYGLSHTGRARWQHIAGSLRALATAFGNTSIARWIRWGIVLSIVALGFLQCFRHFYPDQYRQIQFIQSLDEYIRRHFTTPTTYAMWPSDASPLAIQIAFWLVVLTMGAICLQVAKNYRVLLDNKKKKSSTNEGEGAR